MQLFDRASGIAPRDVKARVGKARTQTVPIAWLAGPLRRLTRRWSIARARTPEQQLEISEAPACESIALEESGKAATW